MRLDSFLLCALVSSIRCSHGTDWDALQGFDLPIFRDRHGHLLLEDLLAMDYYEYEPAISRSENAVEPPLKVGAFNVQTLTDKKFLRDEIMTTVEKVILRYDLILITEIMLKDYGHIDRLMTVLNRLVPEGGKYKISISGEQPNTKETCAFIYRADKLTVHKAETYEDSKNVFYRKPLIVHFLSPTLRDMKEFVALGLHVKPNKAVKEINELAYVYDKIVENYHISDVLMMGDFNADCSYVGEHDWPNISLWTRTEFTWAIKHNMDTTTNHRSCALDRFVHAGSNMNKGVIMSSARAFNFREAYGLTDIETKKVSDHLPIEIQIRGKASEVAEKHLDTELCVTLKDSRVLNASLDVKNLRNLTDARGLVIAVTTTGSTIIKAHHEEEDEMLESIRKIEVAVPGLISKEQIQTLQYKIIYGSLRDDSSYADVTKTAFRYSILHQHNKTTILACRKTTLN